MGAKRPSAAAAPHLVAREADLGTLVEHVRAAMSGDGGALVVVGEPGVGKSTLLDAVAHLAAEAATVLRVTGVEHEMALAWSGLTSVVRPLMTSPAWDDVAPVRRDVLCAALFRRGGSPEGDVDAHSVTLFLMDLVMAAARARPVVLLVDDFHWVDQPSRDALAYLGRRLAGESIALLATSRPDADASVLPTMRLDPPTHADADRMLRHFGVGSRVARAAILEAVGTNPLTLRAAVAELGDEVRDGRAPVPDPIPFPKTVVLSAARRLAPLAATTRAALEAIAILGRPTRLEAQEMLTACGCSSSDLDAAERVELINVGDVIEFQHPTLRTAVHDAMAAPDRRRLHRIAAELGSQNSINRARHRALSLVGVDELVAAELATAAEELASRGATTAGAEELVRAAQLSESLSAGRARLLRAAELFLDAGLVDRVRVLLDGIEPGDVAADVASRSEVARLRARVLHCDERDDDAIALLRDSATAVVADDPTAAGRLLLECLPPLVRSVRLGDIVDVLVQLRALRGSVDADVERRIRATQAAVALRGVPVRDGELAPVEELLRIEGVEHAAPFFAEVIAPALTFARRDAGAYLDEVERVLRVRGAIVPLVSVLGAQHVRHFGSHVPLAIDAAEEAIRLARQIGRPKLAMPAAGGLAMCAGAVGDAAAYSVAAELLDSSPLQSSFVMREVGRAALLVSTGRIDDADSVWADLRAAVGIGTGSIVWEFDYVETLVRLNRTTDALAVMAEIEAQGIDEHRRPRWIRARGLLAEDDAVAGELFADAIAQFRAAHSPISEGRAELYWGVRLRRARRRADARTHLTRALELFRATGVPPLAAEAQSELERCGAHVDGALPVHALLTPQELRLARLVATGSSNREIAVALFVSEKTVENQLTGIYRKLGVKNRSQLAARAVKDPVLRTA